MRSSPESIPLRDTSSPESGRDFLKEAMRESGAVVLEAGENTPPTVTQEPFADLSEPVQDAVRAVAERASTYLSKPIIADTFEDHALRSEWRKTIRDRYSPDVAEFFESNRLRVNALQPLFFKIPALRRALDKEPQTPQTKELAHLLDTFLEMSGDVMSFGDRYRPLSLDEKLSMVRSMSDFARQYLAFVGERAELSEAA